MEYETIISEQSEGVLTITLNRPERLNAVTALLAREFRHALADCVGARVVLIRGSGRSFCTGGDLADVSSSGSLHDNVGAILEEEVNPLMVELLEHELPIVSQVHGYAAGFGASLSLAADFCIASRDACFE